MRDVTSLRHLGPGQLIPLLIGVFSLLRISYVIFRNYMGWQHDRAETEAIIKGSLSEASVNPREESSFEAGLNLKLGQFPRISEPQGHLLHRFLLAWLPWLGLFSSFHRPVSSNSTYSRIGPSMSIIGQEVPSTRHYTATPGSEGSQITLLQFTPQLGESDGSDSGNSINERGANVSRGSPHYHGYAGV